VRRKKRARRRFDEDAASQRALEHLVGSGSTEDIPDYIPISDRRGTEHISDEEAMHAFFDMGYRQCLVDAQRWRAQGPRKGGANKEATKKVRAFARSKQQLKQRKRKLSEEAMARVFLVKTDEAWFQSTKEEQDTKVASLTRLARRRRAARRRQ
jgi:cell fate (sporulation/competence/biofilm development) regulator YlbF (YheA/YmcA/DUF963 family)